MDRRFIKIRVTVAELKAIINGLRDTYNHYEQYSDKELADELEKLLEDNNAE